MRIRFLSLILCLAMVTSIGGAFAAWTYYEPLAPVTAMLQAMLNPFAYAPEEVLPGEGEGGEGTGTVTPGENHLGLLELVLNEDSNFGLNLGNKSVIYSNLQSRKVLFCNQSASGKNLKHLLNHEHNTYGLYFCVEKVSNTLFYLYSFAVSDLPDMGGNGGEIIVYRTTMEKTDKWRGTVSYVGHAQVKKLTAMGASPLNEKDTSDYSIDVTTWQVAD